MRGLKSTALLIVVLIGLGAYIYFYLAKQPEQTGSGPAKEKVFAGLSADKINEIKVRAAAGDVTTLKRDEHNEWRIVEPIQSAADETETSSITSNLVTLAAQRVVDEKPKDLKQFGLDPPKVDVAFKTAGDKDYRHLLIGDKTATNVDMYAKTADSGRVVLIPAFTDGTFNRTTFDLRDKTAMKFDREKVDAIEVTTDGKTLELTKHGDDWTIAKPIQAPADFGSVEGLIGRLQTLQMKSIVSGAPTPEDVKKDGFDKPQATATLTMGSAKATLEIGGSADDGSLYARDTSKPAIFTVEKALMDDLKKGADDYRRKDIFAFRAYNATRFEVTQNGQTVAFEKTKTGTGANAPEQWKRVSPTAGNIDKDKMEAMLTRWANMRASSFVASTEKTGLDKPAAIVVVKYDDGKSEERVTFGKNDNDVYAAIPGQPGAATVDATDFSQAVKSLDELSK